MLKIIGTVVLIMLLCLCGATSIGLGVEALKKRRYFPFGFGIMWAVLCNILIAMRLFNI